MSYANLPCMSLFRDLYKKCYSGEMIHSTLGLIVIAYIIFFSESKNGCIILIYNLTYKLFISSWSINNLKSIEYRK